MEPEVGHGETEVYKIELKPTARLRGSELPRSSRAHDQAAPMRGTSRTDVSDLTADVLRCGCAALGLRSFFSEKLYGFYLPFTRCNYYVYNRRYSNGQGSHAIGFRQTGGPGSAQGRRDAIRGGKAITRRKAVDQGSAIRFGSTVEPCGRRSPR